MSIYLIDNDSFFGYRVRRVIGGVPHQHYFSLLGNGKRLKGEQRAQVEASAIKLDQKLEKQQAKARRSREHESIPSARAGDPRGVKGISVRTKRTNRGDKHYDYTVFQVNCMSKIEGKPVCTTFSVEAHGWQGAWELAVRYYAKHKGLRRYAHLLERAPSQQKAKRILKKKAIQAS